jgi:hypothetical protein
MNILHWNILYWLNFDTGIFVPADYILCWNIPSLSEASVDRVNVLSSWHASFVTAMEQGAAGTLQPNAVYNEGSEVVLTEYFVLEYPYLLNILYWDIFTD